MAEYTRRNTSVLYPTQHTERADGQLCASDLSRADGEVYENPELQRQVLMGNAAASRYVESIQTEEKSRSPLLNSHHGVGEAFAPPQAHPESLGTPEWYDDRHADYLERHGETPPDYYLDYGKRYCLIFSNDLYPTLSSEGKTWLVKTRTLLQLAIEDKLRADPSAFDELEHNSSDFRTFAFSTHSDAYLNAGLNSLPVEDLLRIGLTPDIKDLATMDGVKQVLQTAPSVVLNEAIEFFTEGNMMIGEENRETWLHGAPDSPDVPYQNDPSAQDCTTGLPE